jgi:hypothetical protein
MRKPCPRHHRAQKKSEEILRYNGILLATRQDAGLADNGVLITLKAISVAVRTNIYLAGHDGITAHTNLVKGGIFNDTTGSFGTVGYSGVLL